MNRYRALLLAAVLLGGVTALATTHPLTNIALDDNDAGWFTMDNLDAYGDDLDARGNGSAVVFTGHPAYLMGADRAGLLFDNPRMQFVAVTVPKSDYGSEFFSRLTAALRTGQADYAVVARMTEDILYANASVRTAFDDHYCQVGDADTQELYNRTNATLYTYQPSCPPDRQWPGL